jgi:heme-degrading monooxygenase HmoA
MFARVVKLTCKPGQTKQACQTMNDKVLPILKKQQGFQDELVLVSTNDPQQLLAESFWKSREDAERYHRDQFQKIREIMQDVLATAPVVDTYDVETSMSHRISAGKAA